MTAAGTTSQRLVGVGHHAIYILYLRGCKRYLAEGSYLTAGRRIAGTNCALTLAKFYGRRIEIIRIMNLLTCV